MGLRDWFRSKRQKQQPRALPVRYGLGPPPPKKPKTPDELCPLCSSEVSEVQFFMHWSERDGLGGTVLRGRCSVCDTILFRRFARDESPAWQASIPQPEQLRQQVTSEALQALTDRFKRVPGYDHAWREFLAARRDGDEVWRFDDVDDAEAYAVVRNGRPLAQFRAPPPKLERVLMDGPQ
jgi:hypothetical protein